MNESKLETNRYPASRIVEVAKALSSDVRVRILEALGDKPMSVGQLAEALGIARPTVSINVQMLEQADLIVSSQGANREKSAPSPAVPFFSSAIEAGRGCGARKKSTCRSACSPTAISSQPAGWRSGRISDRIP